MIRSVNVTPHGLKEWVGQRFTAIIMSAYTVILTTLLYYHRPINYESWRHIFGSWWMKILTLLFLFSVFYHAWVGVRDIFMDYIGHKVLRSILQKLVVFALTAYAVWTIVILWSF